MRSILEKLDAGAIRGKADLHRAKVDYCRQSGLESVPSDADLLEAAAEVDPDLAARLTPLLRTKPMRTLSGVAIVAVMTSPAHCPHGRCTFCPGGVEVGSPQAYTGFEPAAMRGARANFDAREQTASRIRQLGAIGHRTDKIDLIVMGGTFTARPAEYQEAFVKGAMDAMNGGPSPTLEAALVRNETAPARCIGLTVETKPDWCRDEHVRFMLSYGTTRVELGIQALDDGVLEAVHRGHTVADAVAATRAARDAGLKVCYHLMPGLPGMTPAKDREGFVRLFEDASFRPDMLKVYPTLVLPQTALFAQWKEGAFEPYDDETAARVVADLKEVVPPWVRIQRVDRDIPSPMIAAGVRRSNLRQLALAQLGRRGRSCACVRCREAGHRSNKGEPVDLEGDLRLRRTDFAAAGGLEVFLELLDGEGALHAFARLRRAGHDGASGSKAGDAFLRELRVVGRLAELWGPEGLEDATRFQHRGLGARLVEACEAIALDDWGCPVLRVTSGVGVRGYYRKLGYALEPPYMVLDAKHAPAARAAGRPHVP
jgi:elongator complex protein 3